MALVDKAVLLLCLVLGAGGAAARGETALPSLLAEARAYEHGEEVAKDPVRAIRLYGEGARRGDAEAQYSRGWMYANGRGTDRDDGLATYYFGLASRQGHA